MNFIEAIKLVERGTLVARPGNEVTAGSAIGADSYSRTVVEYAYLDGRWLYTGEPPSLSLDDIFACDWEEVRKA